MHCTILIIYPVFLRCNKKQEFDLAQKQVKIKKYTYALGCLMGLSAKKDILVFAGKPTCVLDSDAHEYEREVLS
jgi:hypothetical protein